MENVGEVRIMGVELDTQFRFTDQLTGFANLALANGEDTKNDEPLAEIAPVNGNIGAKYAMDNGFWLRAEMPWAWKQDEVPSGTDRTNGWVQVNAAAGYSFDIQNTKHELSLTLDNIFDNEHRNHLANSRNVELLDPGFNAALMYRIAF
jgi:hemoglobin/transferrin/lactoferrin receptor protein